MSGYFNEVKPLLTLAAPLILTQLAQVAVSTTDIMMMGLLDELSLAAGGLAFFLFNLVRTMGFGMVVGVANRVAEAKARHSTELYSPLLAGLAVATVSALLAMVVLLLAPVYLVSFGQSPAVVSEVAHYLAWMAPGLLPAFWFYAYRGIAAGTARARALLWITLASVGVNAALDFILIKGLFGLPAMGVSGIAASSSLVFLLSFIALALLTHKNSDFGRWQLDIHTILTEVRALLKIGIPTAASYGSEAGFFALIALLVGTWGTTALAAHALVNQWVYILFMVSVGLSHAASVRISQAVGQAQPKRQIRVARTAWLIGLSVMLVAAVVYRLIPEQLLGLLLHSGREAGVTLQLAAQLLLIAAGLQCFDCLQNIAIGCLRALDKATAGFWITIAGYWLIGLPAAWFFSQKLGSVLGIWLGLTLGVAATAIMMIAAVEWFNRTVQSTEMNASLGN